MSLKIHLFLTLLNLAATFFSAESIPYVHCQDPLGYSRRQSNHKWLKWTLFSYLLLCNTLPPNLYSLPQSFCEFGMWTRLTWLICFRGSDRATNRVPAERPAVGGFVYVWRVPRSRGRVSKRMDGQQGVESQSPQRRRREHAGSRPCALWRRRPNLEGSRDLGISGLVVGRPQSAGMRVTCVPWQLEALSLQGSGSWHVLSKSQSLAKRVSYPQPSWVVVVFTEHCQV